MRRVRMLPGLVLLVLGAAVCAGGESRAPAPLAVAGLGAGAVPLDGGWEFRTGDSMAWAAPGFDDSSWERLIAGRPWGQQGHARYSGFAWYRKRLDLQAASGAANFEVLFPEVDQAYEIYWNGALVGGCGSLPPHPVWDYDQVPHVFPLAGSATGVLAVRVWNAPPLSDEDPGLKGGLVTTPLVGVPAAIANAQAALDYSWLRGHQFVFTENLVFALVALLSFLAWLRNREQWLLLWMTSFTLSPVLTLLLLDARIPVPYTISMSLAQPLVALRDVSVWLLLLWLLDLRADARLLRLTRVLIGISLAANVLDGAMVAMAWHPRLSRAMQVGDAFTTAGNTVLELYPLVLVAMAAMRRKQLDVARVAVAVSAFVLEMTNVIQDVAGQGRRFTHWKLADRMNEPVLMVKGSAMSLVDALEAVLFVCAVWAVYRSFFEERRRQLAVEQELWNARELQRVLVPEAPFEFQGFRVTSTYLPAQEVGGDFFQVLPAGDGALIVIGDVSGKGLRAAMAVSFLVGALRALATPETGPAELLEELNRRLMGRLQGGFATCLAMRVEADGRCRASVAGHPGPFVDGRELELDGALPLGMFAEIAYPETEFVLAPGETCALYTDGLLEARDRAGELFGFARLAKLFAARPTAEEAGQAAVEFGQDDDITVVSITRAATEQPARSPGASRPNTDEAAVAG